MLTYFQAESPNPNRIVELVVKFQGPHYLIFRCGVGRGFGSEARYDRNLLFVDKGQRDVIADQYDSLSEVDWSFAAPVLRDVFAQYGNCDPLTDELALSELLDLVHDFEARGPELYMDWKPLAPKSFCHLQEAL